jgi:nucleotide-binding universal stress UspA family protein
VEVRALVGDPDKTICDTVAQENIDLIVMSTHGRSGLNRWVYGSVANKVLRGASCPLLLVRNLQSTEAEERT